MNCFRTQNIIIVLCGFSLVGIHPTIGLGQDGTLDTTFGTGGKVTTQIVPGGYESGYALAIQPDGKIVVAGESFAGGSANNYDITVVRYNANGGLDSGFGAGGIVITPVGPDWDLGWSVLIQPDGKIVVGGNGIVASSQRMVLVRYNANGSLDNSFGTAGISTTRIGGEPAAGWSCALQPDGKIVLTGTAYNGSDWDMGVIRFNSDGTLDNSFGTGGKVITAIGTGTDDGRSCALQPDGKIVVAGRHFDNQANLDFAVLRYNSNGGLDNGFGVGGIVITPVGLSGRDDARSMVLQQDGKIVVVGSSFVGSNNNFAVVRYNPNGSLDNSFGSDGKVTTRVGNDVSTGEDGAFSGAIQADGRILAAGWALSPTSGYDFAVVRYTANGNLDSTFGTGGIVMTPIGTNDFGLAVALQADEKIVVAGSSYDAAGDYAFAVVRYNNGFTSGVSSPKVAPQQFVVFQNYPNPFNPSTTIRYTIPGTGYVTLKVYDLLGKEIATLVSKRQAAGEYEIQWNPVGLASGVYLYRLQAGKLSETKKLLIVR